MKQCGVGETGTCGPLRLQQSGLPPVSNTAPAADTIRTVPNVWETGDDGSLAGGDSSVACGRTYCCARNSVDINQRQGHRPMHSQDAVPKRSNREPSFDRWRQHRVSDLCRRRLLRLRKFLSTWKSTLIVKSIDDSQGWSGRKFSSPPMCC